jgi:sterol desaturase/sphingolipid hydroxylase (fatty acid hydroxylase superfamily)
MMDNPREMPGQTGLDRAAERLIGDSLPKHFGTGWFSGLLGVFLSLGSFLAVMVFRYPQWLTMSETAPRYPVETMRLLLALAIMAGFLFSAVNVVLRPSKRLGLTGLFFCMAAILAGGSNVEVGGGAAAFRIGLDWFILNVVLLALIFVPLERLFPLKPDQDIFRAGWTTDGIYFLVSHVAVELMTFFTLLPATLVAQSFHANFSGLDPSALPLAVEVFGIMLVADISQYWVHRSFHRISWAWPFHAIHHSSREMDWLAGSRLHVVDIIVTRALTLAPLLVIGFSQEALYIWLVIIAVQATLNHVNMRIDVPILNQLLVMPRFHHWHHAVTPIDKNFAVHFPWIDRLFGTYHMPNGEWPSLTGIKGDPVPGEFTRQLLWPFRLG